MDRQAVHALGFAAEATAKRLRRIAGEDVCGEEQPRLHAAGQFCDRSEGPSEAELLQLLAKGSTPAEGGT